MLQSVFLNVLFMILINKSVCYVNNIKNHCINDNNLRGVTRILFEKNNPEILLVEKNNDTLYENNHIVNEYDVNLNTDLMKLINDFTIFIMRNDW